MQLEAYLQQRESEAHECTEMLLDRMPEDAVTLLEPTIPCLFWSCAAAYRAAADKIVRLHTCMDPVTEPVDTVLLQKIQVLTRTLRKELYAQGAFVGWLPLDHGCQLSRPPVPSFPQGKQYLSRSPLVERKPTGPDWITYQQTYRRLGPDAAFWYDHLERGIVMFDAHHDPANATLITWKLSPLPQRQLHIVEKIEHLGAVYNLVSLSGAPWRTFPVNGRNIARFPHEFYGCTLSVVSVLRRAPNLAQSIRSALIDLAVRAQVW
ncbi:hypothetical protein CspeluHIS016_0802310 [Cutaneotrichosporon spelunceum]|uniref:Uncharacterized protein n=1 Tax=Cutaneotrichosporon spelunceum TaxID=1672016 RepID=A0AAD3TZA1_9TREE|nr:hypothetical protein CspeluHIS016_0802310 [Cutaneotrichosporon spelunceum]